MRSYPGGLAPPQGPTHTQNRASPRTTAQVHPHAEGRLHVGGVRPSLGSGFFSAVFRGIGRVLPRPTRAHQDLGPQCVRITHRQQPGHGHLCRSGGAGPPWGLGGSGLEKQARARPSSGPPKSEGYRAATPSMPPGSAGCPASLWESSYFWFVGSSPGMLLRPVKLHWAVSAPSLLPAAGDNVAAWSRDGWHGPRKKPVMCATKRESLPSSAGPWGTLGVSQVIVGTLPGGFDSPELCGPRQVS